MRRPSARRAVRRLSAVLLLTFAAVGPAAADTLYKYQDADGNWIFSDRPPADGSDAETRRLQASFESPELDVRHRVEGRRIEFVAENRFHAPVEVMLSFQRLSGIEYPDSDEALRWTVPASGERALLGLDIRSDVGELAVEYQYEYMAGSPDAVHLPDGPYRLPYALAARFTVTQAYPDTVTHRTPDSAHAVDFAMPVGTDIFAARGGTVFAVTSQNYRGGLDTSRDGARANVVQILHDDGTFAVYAHLNWNSIRVKPGDRVQRGQYIADSGNTGFSTGPHLHFAVLRNVGMRLESVPVRFEGRNASSVVPTSGRALTAY